MGKCQFNSDWLQKKDSDNNIVSSWAKRFDEDNIFCCACDKKVSIVKGFQAIEQHSKGKRHKRLFSLKFKSTQLHLVASSPLEKDDANENCTSTPQVMVYSLKENSVRAELYWVLWCIAKNYSFSSNDGICEIFKAMFPVEFPTHFSLSSTKLRYYVTECLGPYFIKKMLDEIEGTYLFITFIFI